MPMIRDAVLQGHYRETWHQRVENVGRPGHDVTRQEAEQVLLSGHREPERDRFEPYDTWSYAVRGSTLDGRELRVAVALAETTVVIVSVYAVTRGGRSR